ncbi:conjugal transfer mating-pair stabilization protein TraG [Pseudescherichia vulneris]|uniref:conjugal transfer mating-pair stabilization protein TraG n=1 Tax=Pseudescherichia vulneris TaxID=566 RepID=UPI0028B00453|nr:conjugal transfer mating-pair stabilization protein TraG [Pseudescherichia vulneris]
MLEIYTIYGGGMWKTALDAIVGILGHSTWGTLMRMAGTFSVLAVILAFVKSRNPMIFVQWLAIFMLVTTILVVPKRTVQIIDITDRTSVWVVDNVPVGLAGIASLSTSIGFNVSSLYDSMFARPASLVYSKTGMLFGSQLVAESNGVRTQNPELAQMLPDYVENCVTGDILLNHKYSFNVLMNSTDPMALITSNPSPLRGIYKTTDYTRQFMTCQEAAARINTLINADSYMLSNTFGWLSKKFFGDRVNGTMLMATAMMDSYRYFYSGGLTAQQVMKSNITFSAIKQGIRGYAARSNDTANLVNLATENAATKQRLSWAAGSALATRTLPFAQSLLMLILICLFPLVIALAAANHSLFGLNTLKIYVCGFLYFQMWPVMFAILNYASNFWLQTKTGGTPLVLANSDVIELQHSDAANLAGYLSLSIPLLSFYLTKGAAAVGSQVAGSVLSSAAFGSAGVASTTADGNWSFNNMSMDNVSQNKMDTNLVQRQGQQTWQADNGSTQTTTAGGHTVIDSSGAMSNLPVNMRLSQLASSGFQESARQSEAQARTALDGYNHSVTSGWSQLSQLSRQTGSTDTLNQGSENSQTTNASRGTSMMMSAVESYAKANHVSTQDAYNQLMTKSQEGSFNAGGSVRANSGDQIVGMVGKWASGVSAEGHTGVEYKGADGSSHGLQSTGSSNVDARHDKNSQAVNDFRQGMDMVTSNRVTDGSSHTENAGTSDVQQFAATLNDSQSQYHQYTTSSTQSSEFSRMATLSQNQSAALDTNYNQEFVDWAANKYGDKAQGILTSAPSAREAAMEFVNERLKPEIMGDYQQGRADLSSGAEHAAFSGEHVVQPSSGTQRQDQMTQQPDAQSQLTASSSGPAGQAQMNSERHLPGQVTGSGTMSSETSYSTPSSGVDGMNSQVSVRGTPAAANSDGVQSGGTVQASNQSTAEQVIHSRPVSQSRGNEWSTGQSHQAGSVSVRSQPSGTSTSHTGDPEHLSHNSDPGSSGYNSQSATVPGGKSEPASTSNQTGAAGAVKSGRVAGDDMQNAFRDNQAKLQEQSGHNFEPQNEMRQRVSEQRSKNEQNINESAGIIDKKQSTVQTSSDILKGEMADAQGKFAAGYENEKGKQNFIPQNAKDEDIQARLVELRKKAG